MNADDLTSTHGPRAAALAIALLATAAIGCGRPSDPGKAARETLEDCGRTWTLRGVRFDCLGFHADVEQYEGLTPIDLIDIYGTELKKLGEGCVSAPFSRDADGTRWEGFHFAAPRTDRILSSRRERLIATARLGDGSARVASCSTFRWFGRSRCEGVTELLVETGAGPWRVASGTPTFLGRHLQIPPGCDVQAATGRRVDVRCGSEASLNATALGARADMARTVEVMLDLIHRGTPESVDEAPRACRIGGAEARCSVVSVGGGAGRIVSVLGAAVAQGEPVFAMCSQPAALPGVHPVCEGVIGFQGAP